jgi:hypothetical protein
MVLQQQLYVDMNEALLVYVSESKLPTLTETVVVYEWGVQVIPCPAQGCDILVDELTVTRLIDDPTILRKYQYLVAKGFVANNKHIKVETNYLVFCAVYFVIHYSLMGQ